MLAIRPRPMPGSFNPLAVDTEKASIASPTPSSALLATKTRPSFMLQSTLQAAPPRVIHGAPPRCLHDQSMPRAGALSLRSGPIWSAITIILQ